MATGYTLEEARAEILHRLDDEAGARYAPEGVYTRVDLAIDMALARRLDEYISAGGDRFNEIVELTTETDGTLDLSAYDPIAVKAVGYTPTGSTIVYPLEGCGQNDFFEPVETAYALRMVLVRNLTVATDDMDEIASGETSLSRGFASFDAWVICTAALSLGVKDNERRQALVAECAEAGMAVLGHARSPKALPWPTMRQKWHFTMDLRWQYDEKTQALTVVRGQVVR